MDDFQVILGMEFFHTAKVVPMPFLGSICMMGEEALVPVSRKFDES